MKKTLLLISLFTVALVMSGCYESSKIQDTDLMHHRFVLINANGLDISLDEQAELIFGEKMTITGKMCNQFSGRVILDKNHIKGTGVAMTKMLCNDDQLNQLDHVIQQLITDGAKISLTNNQLTLKNNKNELIYQLKDLM
ncbi:META domain-containing protein [Gilliamella sp. ESL0250]|uniref:META domain-containing protein n=1 Tax=Gilliamella sp. ESL0250 TaxID=2705036 RepID=UPI0015810997|nr:META domain-containing protein [Gilliamella sp. ESL0250]NUF50067.1 META domain-containing protein [Gilliamella sp. ESL0250]